ncbi:alpha/beta hydrolase [Mucilaginibacter sp.]|uniref:alpha/beta hydrolase n=1 Tax=Mucilaginibacter sp. TaxID=1882438 RepID=UPI0025E163DA|nr:alpha/beta hydrolase [Mucilaginibacter sp.]
MKKLKQIIIQTKARATESSTGFNDLLWQLICYSPKMPARLQQEQLLSDAGKFSLTVSDDYFAKRDLTFNGFKWGNGRHKILITHGWGSKAADFIDMINPLKELNDVQVIAFDAPGNGSSDGDLSNLLLFKLAVEAIINTYGKPDVMIGHSLGAMANIMALDNLNFRPLLLVSLTPLVRLKENFEASMTLAEVPLPAQSVFLESFKDLFKKPAAYYNLNDRYLFDAQLNHWLAYDYGDIISPYPFLAEFLATRPFIRTKNFEGTGHERMIKSAEMIEDLITQVNTALSV